MVNPPSIEEDHPDRPLECERALSPGLNALAGWAVELGWTEAEASRALLRLALARILAAEANAETEAAILEAWRIIHGQQGGLQ